MSIMKTLLLLVVLAVCTSTLCAQRQVDLMLSPSASVEGARCFDIQLRSPHGHDIDVAGQNYRLFFNADKLDFIEDMISHDLDPETYSRIDLISTEDQNIGFLSLSIDGKALSDKTITLDRSGTWQKTLNICFDAGANSEIDLTWANSRKTALFATAEVAMSEWISEERQQVLIPNEIIDYSSLEDQESTTAAIGVQVYPNPVADYVSVELDSEVQGGSLLIKDVIGREMVNEKVSSGATQLVFNLNQWPPGTYTVVLLNQTGDRLALQKVIKVNP